MGRPVNPYCECGNVKERPGDGCDSCRAMTVSAHSSGKPIKHVPKEELHDDTTLLIGRVQNFIHAEWMHGVPGTQDGWIDPAEDWQDAWE